MQFSGLLFFLSILEAGASAVAVVGLGLSYTRKIGWHNKHFNVNISVLLYLNIPI